MVDYELVDTLEHSWRCSGLWFPLKNRENSKVQTAMMISSDEEDFRGGCQVLSRSENQEIGRSATKYELGKEFNWRLFYWNFLQRSA